ncbi:hypothetical protein ABFS82_14G009000 [Erythranthe guttata]|uniref:PWWP domain-containing protein n=2 Tax=Erythranthe guttata TaxID=4155 RepID=A0A022RZY5_ERYGU|nr:PREDICTED: uncharacterized protein LOC105961162 isoform X2 [Erythranthe guttata]XP_012840875.1 PREDICTED: uncharacterized protein LOC105961162 isoform X2 [Erythranthe guttata]EYU45556.1 hypothetical protein MIMGU_mgv1a004694mg [Erythranthe guttata]|eukprot:XP_012840867.1 PREDICTED: uncharacterized protein LOC105961162 isoform X2 [Erythranthe guttata]
MGYGEIKDIEIASMDLYTTVKSRTSNAKRRNTKYGCIESAAPRFCKSRRKNQIALHIAKKENINKSRRLMWLLEATKFDHHRESTSETGPRPPHHHHDEKGVTIEDSSNWSDLSAEETALEMLRSMSKERSEKLGYRGFKLGELVWGRIGTHPWWPGKILDESLANLLVILNKKEGCVLVAFFGDDSFGWLDPKDIVPFEPHFEKKSKQSQIPKFLIGVEEALIEIQKRSALGLTCTCHRSSTFKPHRVRGFLDVSLDGYTGESIYSIDQIKDARKGFDGRKMLSFLQELALRPNSYIGNGARKNFGRMKNVASVLAYRNAVYEGVSCENILAKDFGKKAMDDDLHDVYISYEAPKSGTRNTNKRKSIVSRYSEETTDTKRKGKMEIKSTQENVAAQETQRSSNKGQKSPLQNNDNEKTTMIIQFPPQGRLPSTSELKAKFARFGPFYEPGIKLFWKSSTCQVVFMCRSKAEAAYNHAVQNSPLFGESEAVYYLLPSEGSVSEKLPEASGSSCR